MGSIHTVLGASGGVGRAVVAELKSKGLMVRTVERKPDVPGDETVSADMKNKQDAYRAIKGSSHVYCCIGLPYDSRVWAVDWPEVLQNVMDACLTENAVLVFLDNIYMYGPAPLSVPITEEHDQHPVTKKGMIRKQLANMIFEAIEKRGLKAVIGRSADFYGPHALNSFFYINFLDRMLTGKAPQSLLTPGIGRTYANVADNGRALVALALAPDTYGQVWHLPASAPVTIEEALAVFNRQLGTSFKVSFMPKPLLAILSLFITPLRELKEMLYQFQTPYVVSWDKFKNRFPDFRAGSFEDGVKAMIASFKK